MKKVAALFLIASALLAQQPAPVRPEATGSQQPPQSPLDTAVIRGMVINAATQEPMPDVLVQVVSAGAPTNVRMVVTTDDEGKFTAEKITPGRWSFNLYRNGFVYMPPNSTGTLQRGGVIDVGPGQIVDDVVLGLQRAAVINGRIVDEDGGPMEGMVVEAAQYRYLEGTRELMGVGRATTNDRGEYRIYGLRPGDYYVRVSMESPMAMNSIRAVMGGNSGYVDTYYPNSQDVSLASLLRVTAEAETVGIDLQMARTVTLRVSGQILDPAGRPGMAASIILLDRSKPGRQLNARRVQGAPDGRFETDSLKPGRYRLEATVFARDRSRGVAIFDFELGDRSIEDLIIQSKPTFSVPGHFVIEGEFDDDYSFPSGVGLAPDGAHAMRSSFAYIKEDGLLSFEGVAEDFYKVRGLNLRGLYLKSARYDGRDAMAEPVRVSEGGGEFEVVLSANGARIDGQITREGEGVAGARVVLLPQDRAQTDLIKTSATDQYGVFSLIGIAPGRYKLFAWQQIEMSAWLDPNIVAEVETQGTQVEVEEGDAKRVSPKLIEAKD
jgi:protocatechuate 3,4-dioxygenase beta subunit